MPSAFDFMKADYWVGGQLMKEVGRSKPGFSMRALLG